LLAAGHDVRLAMPLYGTMPDEHRGEHRCIVAADLGHGQVTGALREGRLPGSEVPIYLVEHEGYFDRPHPYHYKNIEYADNLSRFSFFSLAVLDGVRQLGWRPDVVHCNDWHTAGIPMYLKAHPIAHDGFWAGVASVFTIHNMAYQGRFRSWQLPETGLGMDLFHPGCLEYYGDINLMKGAIAFASQINTVSPRYAKEIQTPAYGEGLDGFLRMRAKDISGILNGVDYTEWHPSVDEHLPAAFSVDDLSGKAVCKQALQRECGLADSDAPVFGMVSRFDRQKGLDFMLDALEQMLQRDIQVIVQGSGAPELEHQYASIAHRYPERMRSIFRYDVGLAHRIEAGADFFLMPSRFEPSGLSQLYSLAYGTIPIVRKTGGLADSIRDISRTNLKRGRATGIVFGPARGDALANAMERALRLYSEPAVLHAVRQSGMREDFSWEHSANEYVRLYRKAMARP
jgi:starch synthase